MPLAVVGMLLATLVMVSVVGRHQAHQAQVRSQVRRLEDGIAALGAALEELRGVPLSRELRVTLRADLLARTQRIRRLYRRYPGIMERIQAAEAALNAEGAASKAGVGPIENEQRFRRILVAIDTVFDVLQPGGSLRAIPGDVRTIFRRELGERRAEVMARFHLVQSRRWEKEGNLGRARAHLTTLTQVLRRRGPSTDFVRELHAEAESALSDLGSRQPAVGKSTDMAKAS